MKRKLLRLLFGLSVGCILAVPALAELKSTGTFTVVIVVCHYKDSPAPATTPQDWETVLNNAVPVFFEKATNGQVHFHFVASMHICELGYPYTGRVMAVPHNIPTAENDLFGLDNEGADGVRRAFDNDPNLIKTNDHILVIVNMPKRGQTSFGKHVRYGVGRFQSFALSMVSQFASTDGSAPVSDFVPPSTAIDQAEVRLIEHELGHQLGLVDLYREKDTIGGHTFNAGPEFAEYWCMMGHHNAQNFCGYDRFRAGWVNERQIEKVRPAFTADIDTTIHLLPPTAAAPNSSDRELIYLPTHVGEVVHRNQFGVAIPGWAYLIEGRSLKNLDDQDPDARKAGVTPPQKMVDGGLPFSYLPGVIVSKVKPGFEPVEIKVRDANNVDSCCTLEFAAYGEGTVFDDHHGVTITVNSANPDGSFDVRVQRTRRHLPDVKAEGMWLDSPANGYGTYASGIMQTNRPPAHGDPVFIPIVSEVDWHGPIPHVNIHNGTAAHRLNVRARNQGLADATNVKGTVLLFEPQLLTGIDLTNPESFQNLNPISRHDVAFGDIAQGAFADTSLTINPTGPFMAVLLLNPARSPDGLVEFDLTNNVSIDAFVSIFTAPGSPYHPFELKFPVTNLYPIDRHIRITTDDPPPGWSYELGSTQYPDRDYTYLANGSHDEFRLYVQPPDPAQMRPEDLKAMQHTTIEATASMNYRDSWIDMDTLPVDVYLVKKTVLTLGVKVSGPTALLQGTLVYQDGANTRPMAKAPLVITLNGSDGSRKVFFPGDPRYTAKTSRTGFYQQAVQLRKGVQYVATAQFADTLEYKGSVSAPINLGGSKM